MLLLFSFPLCASRAGKYFFDFAQRSSRFSFFTGKQERDKRPRDEGLVIRDGARPVPRLPLQGR